MITQSKLCVLSVLVLSSLVQGQRDPRFTPTYNPPSWPSPVARLAKDGKLKVSVYPDQDWVVDTQMALPGQVFSWALDFSAPENYLASGRVSATGAGVIQHWRLTNVLVPPTLVSTRTVANRDFIAVAYDKMKETLYALDAVTNTIESVHWSGTGALPVVGWTTLVNATELPELLTPDIVMLGISRNSSATYLSIGLYQHDLIPMMTGNRPREKINIDDTWVPASINRRPPNHGWTPSNFSLDALNFAEGRTSVTINIEAAETGAFEVVDLESSTVIGTATAPGNATQLVIPLGGSALSLGSKYLIKKVSGATVLMFGRECYARYGAPETTANGIKIGRIHLTPFAEVGESRVHLYTDVYTDNTALADANGQVTVTGAFALAMRDPLTGLDPVINVGSNWLLQTDLFVAGSAVIDGVPGHGYFGSESFGIPDDPSLIGSVLLQQAYILDQNWYVSDIIGVMVKSHMSSAASKQKQQPIRRSLLEALLEKPNAKILRSARIFFQAFGSRQGK